MKVIKKVPKKKKGAVSGLRAVILAGGKGVRLQPFTVNFPKPLVPLGDTPVIEVLMRRIINCGITDITLTLGHLAELMKAYFDYRQKLYEKITLRYVEEEKPTGTAGSLAIVPGLTDTFLVMNGDLLTDLDLNELVDFHRKQKAALTIATHKRHVKIDLGVLEFDHDHQVTTYIEKPKKTYDVSMGIYVYEPRVLKYIEQGKYLDFPDLVLRLLSRGEKVCAYYSRCLWLDIGRSDDYSRAQELFAKKRERFEHV
jgi:NDP-sugar pyrophosphorylase family protein